MVTELSECLLATVLILAGAAKLFSGRAFRRTLEVIPWLPQWSLGVGSRAVPAVEVVVGILFLTQWAQQAAWGSLLLFLTFAVPVLWAVKNGHQVSCACFGSLSSGAFEGKTVWRLAGLSVVALVPILTRQAIALAQLPTVTLVSLVGGTATIWLISIVVAEIGQQFIQPHFSFRRKGS